MRAALNEAVDNPPSSAFMIENSAGDVVAYVDAGPTTLPGGGSEEPREYGGNLRLKGAIFENWTTWDYWD